MQTTDTLEESKLLQLLEAVESVLEHEDAEQILDVDTLRQFADIQRLLRAWLQNESALTHEQSLGLLENFTKFLALKKSISERNEAPLH